MEERKEEFVQKQKKFLEMSAKEQGIGQVNFTIEIPKMLHSYKNYVDSDESDSEI